MFVHEIICTSIACKYRGFYIENWFMDDSAVVETYKLYTGG